MSLDLHNFDQVIINSSAGKDSLVAIWEVCRMAAKQEYCKSKISISHQDLGKSEWAGTKELAKVQADLFGLPIYYSKRRNKAGYEETLLEYVLRRGKWPDNKNRYCTSDFKRGPGQRVVTALTKGKGKCKILYVFGFRRDESPARSKKQILTLNKNLTTKTRIVYDYLPVHDWPIEKVWKVIKDNKLPYHWAYDLGMPRLSCVFCVFSPFDALVIAAKHNPDLLDEYIEVEDKIGHTFRNGFSLHQVKIAIENGYYPERVNDWIM